MLENLVEQRRNHLGALMNVGNGLVEVTSRRRREEVESRSLCRRLDSFQPGRAKPVRIFF